MALSVFVCVVSVYLCVGRQLREYSSVCIFFWYESCYESVCSRNVGERASYSVMSLFFSAFYSSRKGCRLLMICKHTLKKGVEMIQAMLNSISDRIYLDLGR